MLLLIRDVESCGVSLLLPADDFRRAQGLSIGPFCVLRIRNVRFMEQIYI